MKQWTPQEVKELRMSRNLSQEIFGNQVGISLMTVRRLEDGLNNPSNLTIKKLNDMEARVKCNQRQNC